MRILCTGGAGYIGGVTTKYLTDAKYEVIILDNFSNVPEETPSRQERIRKICRPDAKITFENVDLRNKGELVQCLEDKKPDAVIHFAALKSVCDSMNKPLEYYDNNVGGFINLLQAMDFAKCQKLLFSGSAAVYPPSEKNLSENVPTNPASVYGKTKVLCEQILSDYCSSNKNFRAITLRYFNPIGADDESILGDNPDLPMSIFPLIQQTAAGIRPELIVTGNDYNTPDGTGVRDYIDIRDLATAHVSALNHIPNLASGCHKILNVGTGKGSSVSELIHTFEKVTGQKVNSKFGPRRPGDIGRCVADPSAAEKELQWKAERTVEDSCLSAWKFMENYKKA
eukprot:GHVP01021153.1.p2 GENE.GHVP01021153.1~~GHVP01021153.1.p2  ORF type:complete len:340 (-),score=61.28 GHVP01021153.1:2279-3298(-)